MCHYYSLPHDSQQTPAAGPDATLQSADGCRPQGLGAPVPTLLVCSVWRPSSVLPMSPCAAAFFGRPHSGILLEMSIPKCGPNPRCPLAPDGEPDTVLRLCDGVGRDWIVDRGKGAPLRGDPPSFSPCCTALHVSKQSILHPLVKNHIIIPVSHASLDAPAAAARSCADRTMRCRCHHPHRIPGRRVGATPLDSGHACLTSWHDGASGLCLPPVCL